MIEVLNMFASQTESFRSGLREKHRLEKPFMFENPNTVCPVKLFKYYISKRPAELRLTGPLYLAVIDKPASDIWYKKSPVGVNTLDNIMKNMIKNSTLANTITKKVTNHSARKTLVKKLKKNKVPKSDIITITGHTTEAGLDDYDNGNEEHQESLSHKIDHNIETSTDVDSSSFVSKDDPRIANPCFSFFPSSPVMDHPLSIFGSFIPLLQRHAQAQSYQAPVHNNFHFHNCTDLKISGFPQQTVSISPQQKKRRYVIYDSDSSQEH